ncbi:MAG: sigma 54-interacting transcriptional regulator [Planctomycetales bacterium]|nr:sigma 54-interacting transcriptional regulator [Planctomycetales bacterium]
MHTYLRMLVGESEGRVYSLDPHAENRVGRGTECTIMLADGLCSRVHAIIEQLGNLWHVRDAGSRNGTFVNGQKIDDAVLSDGHVLRVGGTQFSFHSEDIGSSNIHGSRATMTQTLVMQAAMGGRETKPLELEPIPDKDQARELLLLYQLSIKLLGCDDPRQVVEISLDLLHHRTNAAVIGFLWVDDEGHLKPQLVIPADAADSVTLDESLTELVIREGHAVWIANQEPDGGEEENVALTHYADAVCAPLVHDGATLGAIHVYLERGRFRQSDFDFAISVANIVSVALVRAREHTSLQSDLDRLKQQSPGFDDFIGESQPMLELKSKIQRVAKAAGCVLVRGESGAGKELVARAIHRASPRADRPLLSVNCAAIPADLMESQLFGHKAGAFTGADRDHAGYFAQADLGTLFLDEVGELTLEGQAKLLRILEGHPFLPVGATAEVKVDVRVIAATNQNLQTYVREKKFREDLYYRLSVFELQVPPLRNRDADIGLLIDFFLASFREQHGRPRLQLSDAARQRLLAYGWPGNVRQLRNVMDSAVVLAEGAEIVVNDLALHDVISSELETLAIDYWERKLIGEALKRTDGNVPDAAKLLGIGRATLYRKIDQYGINR